MAKLTFREYTTIMLLTVFSLAMVINFSGSILSNYDTNSTDSQTLQEIKSQTDSQRTDLGTLRNRTEGVNIDESAFLSPQGYSIASDTLSNVANIPNIVQTAISELGLPPSIVLLSFIPIAGLIWEGLSLLFGLRT